MPFIVTWGEIGSSGDPQARRMRVLSLRCPFSPQTNRSGTACHLRDGDRWTINVQCAFLPERNPLSLPLCIFVSSFRLSLISNVVIINAMITEESY